MGVEERIIKMPDDRLTERWPEADFTTSLDTMLKMIEWSKEGASDGRSLAGLSSVQVALPGRVVTIPIAGIWGGYINPVVVEKSKFSREGIEGCFSLPRDDWYWVTRPEWVDVEYGSPEDRKIKRFSNWEGIIVQHEIDHLNGILISDIGELRLPRSMPMLLQKH